MSKFTTFFAVVTLGFLILITGCTSTGLGPTQTPTTQIPIKIQFQTNPPALSPSPTEYPSACEKYIVTASCDKAFVDFLTRNDVITRSGDLAQNCDEFTAKTLNKLLVTGPSPGSQELMKARGFLIEVASECQAPTSNSEVKAIHFMSQMTDNLQEYNRAIAPCLKVNNSPQTTTVFPVVTMTPVVRTAGAFPIRGELDAIKSFEVSTPGTYVFSVNYSGEKNFRVRLQDQKGYIIDQFGEAWGAYSVNRAEQLSEGIYILDVWAYGPWIISVST